MGVGKYGTLVIRRPRVVRKGGKVTFQGNIYQNDLLLPYVGQTVMVDTMSDYDIDSPHIYECWSEQIGSPNLWKLTGRKRRYQTRTGEWICRGKLIKPKGD